MRDLSHLDDNGSAKMVDVSEKEASMREAAARARVFVNTHTFSLIEAGKAKKGDVLAVAQIAGIQAAKRTCDLIPLCHPLLLTHIDVNCELIAKGDSCYVEIVAQVRCRGETGVEMEALTAASVAALTVYDMCKSAQRDIMVGDICLLKKSGGKSGDYSLWEE